ncbi:hypothetical protein [Parasitella parasitica]|uniref:Uncharacterized protein n=1 Tax=Parasitella parasitica TaxID=35722 RepID=A0A0B7MUG8_9FUNG|nr:hypothetical protein [Parasitella parasitica]
MVLLPLSPFSYGFKQGCSILKFFDLKQYAHSQNAPIQDNEIHPNFNIFDFTKLKEHGLFQNSFMTDGFSTSFTFLKIVSSNSLPSLTLQDLTPEDLNHCKIWGIGTSVKEVFVAVDDSDRASEVSSNAHHQVLRFSSSEYYKDQGIDVLESGVTSPKTTQMDQISRYIADILDRLERPLTFYGVEFQRLKFLNYMGRQKVHNKLINIFLNGGKKPPRTAEASNDPPAGPSTTRRDKWRKQEFQRTPEDIVPVVCLGDGNFGRRTFRGRPHGLARTLRRLLREAENQGHLISIDINERYTSQDVAVVARKIWTT